MLIPRIATYWRFAHLRRYMEDCATSWAAEVLTKQLSSLQVLAR